MVDVSNESSRPSHSEPDDLSHIDPRDQPAEFGSTVGLTVGAAVLITAVIAFFGTPGGPGGVKWMLLGPIGLVLLEVIVHDVWWRRWWGALPGAVAGLVIYFEGRATISDILGESWAGHVAYVLAWAAFAAIFAYASRWPRTDFSAQTR